MGGEGAIPALRIRARGRQGDVLQAVQERQDLRGLLPEQGHRHPPELSVLRREGRQGHHARTGIEPMPRGQWRGALLLCEGRDGGADRLYGVHLARQADGHQDPQRSARAASLRERQGIFLHAARPAQLLLRDLPRAEPRRAHSRRGSGARARDFECDADLPLGMERHGHDQPALHHLQQPDPRRAARAAVATNTATSNITCPMSATGCRSPVRERGHEVGCGSFQICSAGVDAAGRGRCIRSRCGLRSRLQGGLCRGRSRQQGGRRLAQPMDHDGGGTGGCEEGRRRRRFRPGGRSGEGS